MGGIKLYSSLKKKMLHSTLTERHIKKEREKEREKR